MIYNIQGYYYVDNAIVTTRQLSRIFNKKNGEDFRSKIKQIISFKEIWRIADQIKQENPETRRRIISRFLDKQLPDSFPFRVEVHRSIETLVKKLNKVHSTPTKSPYTRGSKLEPEDYLIK